MSARERQLVKRTGYAMARLCRLLGVGRRWRARDRRRCGHWCRIINKSAKGILRAGERREKLNGKVSE
jgi:hypothetical protein